MMHIRVIYAHADGTVGNDDFLCSEATRNLVAGGINIVFPGAPGTHVQTGKKTVSVQYPCAAVAYTYLEEDQ